MYIFNPYAEPYAYVSFWKYNYYSTLIYSELDLVIPDPEELYFEYADALFDDIVSPPEITEKHLDNVLNTGDSSIKYFPFRQHLRKLSLAKDEKPVVHVKDALGNISEQPHPKLVANLKNKVINKKNSIFNDSITKNEIINNKKKYIAAVKTDRAHDVINFYKRYYNALRNSVTQISTVQNSTYNHTHDLILNDFGHIQGSLQDSLYVRKFFKASDVTTRIPKYALTNTGMQKQSNLDLFFSKSNWTLNTSMQPSMLNKRSIVQKDFAIYSSLQDPWLDFNSLGSDLFRYISVKQEPSKLVQPRKLKPTRAHVIFNNYFILRNRNVHLHYKHSHVFFTNAYDFYTKPTVYDLNYSKHWVQLSNYYNSVYPQLYSSSYFASIVKNTFDVHTPAFVNFPNIYHYFILNYISSLYVHINAFPFLNYLFYATDISSYKTKFWLFFAGTDLIFFSPLVNGVFSTRKSFYFVDIWNLYTQNKFAPYGVYSSSAFYDFNNVPLDNSIFWDFYGGDPVILVWKHIRQGIMSNARRYRFISNAMNSLLSPFPRRSISLLQGLAGKYVGNHAPKVWTDLIYVWMGDANISPENRFEYFVLNTKRRRSLPPQNFIQTSPSVLHYSYDRFNLLWGEFDVSFEKRFQIDYLRHHFKLIYKDHNFVTVNIAYWYFDLFKVMWVDIFSRIVLLINKAQFNTQDISGVFMKSFYVVINFCFSLNRVLFNYSYLIITDVFRHFSLDSNIYIYNLYKLFRIYTSVGHMYGLDFNLYYDKYLASYRFLTYWPSFAASDVVSLSNYPVHKILTSISNDAYTNSLRDYVVNYDQFHLGIPREGSKTEIGHYLMPVHYFEFPNALSLFYNISTYYKYDLSTIYNINQLFLYYVLHCPNNSDSLNYFIFIFFIVFICMYVLFSRTFKNTFLQKNNVNCYIQNNSNYMRSFNNKYNVIYNLNYDYIPSILDKNQNFRNIEWKINNSSFTFIQYSNLFALTQGYFNALNRSSNLLFVNKLSRDTGFGQSNNVYSQAADFLNMAATESKIDFDLNQLIFNDCGQSTLFFDNLISNYQSYYKYDANLLKYFNNIDSYLFNNNLPVWSLHKEAYEVAGMQLKVNGGFFTDNNRPYIHFGLGYWCLFVPALLLLMITDVNSIYISEENAFFEMYYTFAPFTNFYIIDLFVNFVLTPELQDVGVAYPLEEEPAVPEYFDSDIDYVYNYGIADAWASYIQDLEEKYGKANINYDADEEGFVNNNPYFNTIYPYFEHQEFPMIFSSIKTYFFYDYLRIIYHHVFLLVDDWCCFDLNSFIFIIIILFSFFILNRNYQNVHVFYFSKKTLDTVI